MYNQIGSNLVQAPFGVMIPGYLSQTQFLLNGNYYMMDIQNAQQVHSIALFLLNPIPEGYAVCLFYSRYPFDGISFLGAIANQRPSDIFATSFNQILTDQDQIKLVLSVEPINEQITELVQLTNDAQNKLKYGLTIAQNLYNFMTAYNKEVVINGQEVDVLITPANVLQIWLQKLQQKYKENPNFIYKTTK
ncbi:unnamed protein product (macronuclear) [Paramecium tetraurelia]|uniref:Hikeshi-like N-terminal domain-containing protein n=1 Tax=Paramecium tetraurelia TaxID=5888 RepID=A0DWH8_PARTE|nr:uncharacterized protein GSPATT00021037001 [Paramecium tetraurelia]CAK87395.1 unnamed protein product [Paramecium tetraurelia]|eukprot:XP_001454792.1 hypothetical protein (macronuclear) [Paramecium tetraurelia strain d4-2]